MPPHDELKSIAPALLRDRVSQLVGPDYEISDQPGSYRAGGFALVLKAIHVPTDEVVALKLPGHSHLTHADAVSSASMSKDCDDVGRVLVLNQEISTLRSLATHLGALHPRKSDLAGVPQILQAGMATLPDGLAIPYFTTAWFEYGTLESATFDTSDPVRRDIVVARLVAQLARVVAALHSCKRQDGGLGFIHRDIKPANVMFADASRTRPILIDYGLSLERDDGVRKALLGTLRPAGTPRYMSPEQANGDQAITDKSDVFSLGILLFQLVSGRLPWVGMKDDLGFTDTLRVMSCGEVLSLTDTGANPSPRLNDICSSALSKSKDSRPIARQLADDLDAFVHDLQTVMSRSPRQVDSQFDKPDASGPRLPDPSPRPPAGDPRPKAIAAVLLAICSAILYFETTQRSATSLLNMLIGWARPPGETQVANKVGDSQPSQSPVPQPDAVSSSPTIATLSRLSATSKKVLPKPLVEGEPLPRPLAKNAPPETGRREPATLAEQYYVANPAMTERFQRALDSYNHHLVSDAKGANHEKPHAPVMTLVAGAAGVGKSYVVDELHKQWPAGAAVVVDIRTDLYDRLWAGSVDKICPALEYTIIPEGSPGSRKEALSCMPALKTDSKVSLKAHLANLYAKGHRFIIIDSLDEINPQDFIRHLRDIDDFVFEDRNRFVHVAVFGRPEAFWRFWATFDNNPRPSAEIEWLALNPPSFRTTGDLSLATHHYDVGSLELVRGGQTMSLLDYIAWEKSGYSLKGEWMDVAFKGMALAKPPIDPKARLSLRDWCMKEQFMVDAISNLDGKNQLLGMMSDGEVFGDGVTARSLLDLMFSQHLERGARTHGRPEGGVSGFDLYKSLLHKIAVKYAPVADQTSGCFWVGFEDTVSVTFRGTTSKVFVRDILDCSGLALLDPPRGNRRRYRFDPIWTHEYLYRLPPNE